jgi:pyruvate kinase
MTTHTKIICTIGPSVNSVEKILQLIDAGMNAARLNFSHGTHEEHLTVINNVKEARRRSGQPIAIILDTKGPEIRIGKVKGELRLPEGHKWLLVKESIEGDLEKVTITPSFVVDQIKVDDIILIDNGYIEAKVIEPTPEGVLIEILHGGIITSNKGVNIPHSLIDLPAITDRDIADIRFGCEHDVDIIAASFVRSADHVLQIKKLLADENKPETLVMAKIENSEGVHNFDSIVQVADGIMIARGDLGVEVPLSHVPKLQKMMIRKSMLAGKPSVTATQMLESMINHPRPTRAEVSDVANAIYDSTSAVMLSGETAVGKYAIETVKVMKSIIKETEADFPYRALFDQHGKFVYHDVPSAVTMASVKAAYTSHAKAFFTFTSKGTTARLLSRLRPDMPIVAMTPSEKCYHQMAMNWGVIPILAEEYATLAEAFAKISAIALEKNIVSYGDLVVVTGGSPFGIPGTTNMMLMENIGDVLVRGFKGYGRRMHGNVAIALTADSKLPYMVTGKILVIPTCNEYYLPLLRKADAIILQNHIDDKASEEYAEYIAQSLGKTLLIRADAACRVLKEGQLVTIDPEKALVYNRILPA